MNRYLPLGICLLVALPAFAQSNLIANSGFEAGQERWLFNSANLQFGRLTLAGAAHSGERCLQVDSYSSHYAQYVAQDVLAPAAGQYRLSAWVRHDGGYVQLRLSGSGTGGAFGRNAELHCFRGHPLVPAFVALEDTAGVHDTDWHCLQLLVDIPAGTASARAEIGFNFTPGRFWVDDFSLTPVTDDKLPDVPPEPSAPGFSNIRGDWQKEWGAHELAVQGLAGATGRPVSGPASAPLSGLDASLTEGPEKLPVAFADPVRTRLADGWKIRREFADGSGRMIVQSLTRPTHSRTRVTIDNAGSRERRFTVALTAPTNLGGDAHFWDGSEESPVAGLKRRRDGPIFMFPAACLYDEREGAALGLAPEEDLSHFAFEACRPGPYTTITCSANIVVEPGAGRLVDFVGYSFAPRWAWREAVQVYHEIFPTFARPTPGIDPRLLGTDGFIYGSVATRDLQMEECRRFSTDWEWVYGQFQTPGDWYPDPEHWQDAKKYTGPTDLHHNEVRGTIDDYFRATRNRFHRGREGSAMLFYFVPQMCDQGLLKTEYPDSWWIEDGGGHTVNQRGDIKVEDDTAWAWPLNTSYGRAVSQDLRLITQDFQPAGFAFDVAHGFKPYFGPAQVGGPGRAWAGDKSYVIESVALGALMDEIHTLRANGHTLGLCANGTYTHLLGRRSDVTMFEPPPFEWQHYSSRLWPVRLVTGGKPLYFHGGHSSVMDVVRPADLSPATAEATVRGANDYMLLSSLWLGGFPPSIDARGFPKVQRWMPMLHELVRVGWQPVPAVDAEPRLLASRYGTGTQSFLALSNPTRETVSGRARLQTAYLGFTPLLCRYDGSALTVASTTGATSFAYTIPSHEALVCRAPVGIGAPGTFTGAVTYDPDALRASDLVAAFTASQPGPAPLEIRLPEGARIQSVIWNGKNITRKLGFTNPVEETVALARRNELTIRWEPQVLFGSPRQYLLDLPLMAQDQARCALVVPPGTDEEARLPARRVASYVEYYLRRQQNAAGHVWALTADRPGVQPPLLTLPEAPPEGVLPILVGDPSAFGLRLQPPPDGGLVQLVTWQNRQALLIAGSTVRLTDLAVQRLLSLLDERYPVVGLPPATELHKRAGMVPTQ